MLYGTLLRWDLLLTPDPGITKDQSQKLLYSVWFPIEVIGTSPICLKMGCFSSLELLNICHKHGDACSFPNIHLAVFELLLSRF